jgi:hypothetical protein
MKLSSVVASILVGTLSSADAQTVLSPRSVVFQLTCLDCSFGLPLLPTGINAAGVVVANSPDLLLGFILDHGSISPIPTLEAGSTNSVNGINDSGVVVGASWGIWDGHAGNFAYTWDGTTLTNLGDPINVYRDDFASYAAAVNASGQVAGHATWNSQYSYAGFIYTAGVMTGIVVPGADLYATGISSQGRVVGTADGDTWWAWTYKAGKLTSLNGNSERSDAFAINDHDQIAGDVHIDSGSGQVTVHAVISKRLDSFDKADWVVMNAVGINDAGQIIGTGTFQGHPQAFLATPVE